MEYVRDLKVVSGEKINWWIIFLNIYLNLL